MHGQHALLGHEVVHDRKHALLHFAGVLRSQNGQLVALEVEVDTRFGRHLFGVTVGRKSACIHDGEVGTAKAGQLLLGRANEHVAHEERVVGARANDADLQAILRGPTGKSVKHIQPLYRVEVINGPLSVDLVVPGIQRDVDLSPPDVVGQTSDLDYAFVLRAASGFLATTQHQPPQIGDSSTFFVEYGFLIEFGAREVAGNIPVLDSEVLKREIVAHGRVWVALILVS